MMLFQNVMRPTGEDLSEGAMREAGERINQTIANAESRPQEQVLKEPWTQKEVSNAMSFADKLRYISNQRGTNYLSPLVMSNLRLVDKYRRGR
jgi:hypothetical protein